MEKTPTAIAKEYLASLRRSAAGEAEPTEYLKFWSEDIEYTCPGYGPWPASLTWTATGKSWARR